MESMAQPTEVLERFHGALVEEILARRPEYLRTPFTVAEIYQNLIPYRTHRDRLGIEINGDYEDALIRLLAGEGGFLILESPPALRALREELASSNPNTGLYREFAAVDVRLNPALVPGGTRIPMGSPAPAEAVSMEDLAPDPRWASAGEAADAPPAPAVGPFAPRTAAGEAPAGADTEACRWCRAGLPARANLNFCPFCGTDVHVVPCPGCGEELDPEWRFCIACGTEVGGG